MSTICRAGLTAAFLFVATFLVAVSGFAQGPAQPIPAPAIGPSGDSAAARELRVFRLVHREPSQAVALVEPLLSAEGTISLAPRAGTLTVIDSPERLRIVEEVIRQFDLPPRVYRVQITFYRASTDDEEIPSPEEAGRAPAQLRGLGRRLRDLLRYTDYEKVGEVVVTTEEAAPVSTRMGEDFLVEFQLDSEPIGRERVRVRNFRVDRVRRDDDGHEQLSHVFRTSLNLRTGQPFVLGAARDESSRTALLIVLNATPGDDPVVGN